VLELGLYQIYFFLQPDFARFGTTNDKSGYSRIFKLTNFTNLMRVKHYERMNDLSFWLFFCAAVTITSFTHTRAVICHSNVSSTYYVSKKYLNNQIRQNYPAPVGFLPEPDLEKVPDSGRSRSRNLVQPQVKQLKHVCVLFVMVDLFINHKNVCDWL